MGTSSVVSLIAAPALPNAPAAPTCWGWGGGGGGGGGKEEILLYVLSIECIHDDFVFLLFCMYSPGLVGLSSAPLNYNIQNILERTCFKIYFRITNDLNHCMMDGMR